MVFPVGLLAQACTLRQGRTHPFPNTGLESVITDHLRADTTFDVLALPFGAVTMDVATAATYVVMEGRLVRALQASAAIPGIFPEVTVDGHQLSDCSVVANMPVTQALEMGHRLSPLGLTVPARAASSSTWAINPVTGPT